MEQGNDRKPQDANKFIVRFPDGMRQKVKELAKKEDRSMNYMVVKLVELGMKISA